MRQITFALPLFLSLHATGAFADCITDWSEAAPIVHENGLATVEALSRIAAAELPGVLVKTTLCEEGGEFYYRILVRDAQGQIVTRTVDARRPFGR